MPETQPKEVFDILLESLKIQAEKYKAIVSQDALTHDQRKDFDAEIKQMYELLSNMTNSSTVYTLSEIQQLKVQYELKIQELQTTLDNIDVTTVKGDTGKSAYEIAVQNGFEGTETEWLQSLNGQDATPLTYNDLTQEEKDSLKGVDGKSAYELALQDGFEGSQTEWLQSLNGQDGNSLTYNDLTTEQKQELANLIPVSGGGSSLSPKSSAILFENQIKANSKNHVKTSFKPNSSFVLEYHYFINSANNFRQSRKLFFNFDTTLTINDVLITESGSFVTPYLSNDGYLCFYISGADYFSLFEFSIVSALSNDSLKDVVFTVLNNSISGAYYSALTTSNYLLLKAGAL